MRGSIKAPPSAAMRAKRCLLQIARRVHAAASFGQQPGPNGEDDEAAARAARRAVRYQPASGEEAVFLHPRSALHRAAPQLLAFAELVRTEKRPYMSGARSGPCCSGRCCSHKRSASFPLMASWSRTLQLLRGMDSTCSVVPS